MRFGTFLLVATPSDLRLSHPTASILFEVQGFGGNTSGRGGFSPLGQAARGSGDPGTPNPSP